MSLREDQVRACGFSGPKVGFIKDLAAHVSDGRLDLAGLKKHPDDEVMRQLVAVKGIGRWTAEIFLMFRLGRPDAKRLRKMGEVWKPHRSVAAWYLWASLSDG